MKNKVTILGAGAWGTALAINAAKLEREVLLYTLPLEQVEEINHAHTNKLYFPDIILPSNIVATNDVQKAIDFTDFIMLVIPVQNIRSFLENSKNCNWHNKTIIICSKGIENGSCKLVSEIIAEYLDNEIIVLSGPNFATEIALGMSTATTLAGNNHNLLISAKNLIETKEFKCETSEDIIGTQLFAAFKNVLAVGCGMARGLDLGDNFAAHLFKQGVNELIEIVIKCGGKRETIFTSAGLGDLCLTCNNQQSRNFRFGVAIGSGNLSLNHIEDFSLLAEGYKTSETLEKLFNKISFESIVFSKIHAILYKNISPKSILEIV